MKFILQLIVFAVFLMPEMEIQANPCAVQPLVSVSMNQGAGNGNWLIVDIKIGDGKALPFVVDTGTPVTIVSQALVLKLGRQMSQGIFTLPDGPQHTKSYASADIYLGDMKFTTGRSMVVMNLEKLQKISGQPVTGILGMDVLQHYCIQMDFASGKLSFFDRNGFDTNKLGNAFKLIFSREDQGEADWVYPYIDHVGLLGGPDTNVLIDTGNNIDGDVDAGQIRRHAKDSYRGNCFLHITQYLAASGLFGPVPIQMHECQWEGMEYDNIHVRSGKNSLGLRFLGRHVVTLDFPNHMMYLKKITGSP